jgi:hypothetical protein
VTSFVLESGLIFGVLYLLAYMNYLLVPGIPDVAQKTMISINGVVFLCCLVGTRRAILGEAANVRREVVVLGAVSALLAALALAVWVALDRPATLTPGTALLITMEGLIAIR